MYSASVMSVMIGFEYYLFRNSVMITDTCVYFVMSALDENEESEEEADGADGDDNWEESDEGEDDPDDDDDDVYATESESEFTSESEELVLDDLGVWGEQHPQFSKKLKSNSRVKFSTAETAYILSFMRSNPKAGARACLQYVKLCPKARKIFHYHHVQYPGRMDSKFKDMKKCEDKK